MRLANKVPSLLCSCNNLTFPFLPQLPPMKPQWVTSSIICLPYLACLIRRHGQVIIKKISKNITGSCKKVKKRNKQTLYYEMQVVVKNKSVMWSFFCVNDILLLFTWGLMEDNCRQRTAIF
jgi:hypothetical protein